MKLWFSWWWVTMPLHLSLPLPHLLLLLSLLLLLPLRLYLPLPLIFSFSLSLTLSPSRVCPWARSFARSNIFLEIFLISSSKLFILFTMLRFPFLLPMSSFLTKLVKLKVFRRISLNFSWVLIYIENISLKLILIRFLKNCLLFYRIQRCGQQLP